MLTHAGHEAAAHGGDVTSLVLIPSIRARVDLPIIAAGGCVYLYLYEISLMIGFVSFRFPRFSNPHRFGTGQGLLAALSLGADAVAMGTRFACTQESPLHENVKQAIVQEKMTEADTIYSKNFDGIFARAMRTPTTEQAAKRVGLTWHDPFRSIDQPITRPNQTEPKPNTTHPDTPRSR